MKKIIAIVAVSLFLAPAAFAAGTTGTITLSLTSTGLSLYGAKGTSADNTSPLIGKTSTGVGVGVDTASAGYSIITQHKNGSKVYGSSFDSTSIYSNDVTAGTAYSTTLTTGSDSFAAGSGWTTM